MHKNCEKMQREITRKVSKLELCHLCAARLIIWIYIPIKVYPNTLNSFGAMEYTQKFVKNKYKKNTYLKKIHFSPKNWVPTEKNMASYESRDPEETMCEIRRTQVEYFARKSNLSKGEPKRLPRTRRPPIRRPHGCRTPGHH